MKLFDRKSCCNSTPLTHSTLLVPIEFDPEIRYLRAIYQLPLVHRHPAHVEYWPAVRAMEMTILIAIARD
jgi:hypothetical protein